MVRYKVPNTLAVQSPARTQDWLKSGARLLNLVRCGGDERGSREVIYWGGGGGGRLLNLVRCGGDERGSREVIYWGGGAGFLTWLDAEEMSGEAVKSYTGGGGGAGFLTWLDAEEMSGEAVKSYTGEGGGGGPRLLNLVRCGGDERGSREVIYWGGGGGARLLNLVRCGGDERGSREVIYWGGGGPSPVD